MYIMVLDNNKSLDKGVGGGRHMDLQKKLDSLSLDWGFQGTVCIAKDGLITAHGAYGMADEENHIPFTEETNCYIASVTKQFTAACIMMLYEKRLLELDAKLDKYIPEYSHAGEVTLRQLLNMRSGIPDELKVIYNRETARYKELGLSDRDFQVYRTKACAPEKCSFRDFLEIVNPLPLNSIPGTSYEYSDTNYMLLGEVVARISGKPLGAFMEENIFTPLDMKDTIFGADKSEAASYMLYEGEYIALGRAHFITGEGAICTTAMDLSKWLKAVTEGRLLKKSSWRQVFKLVEGYGFGWQDVGEWYCHNGNDLGYYSYVYINKKERITIAAICNHEMAHKDMIYDLVFQRSLRKAVSGEYMQLKAPRLAKLDESNFGDVLAMHTLPEQEWFVAPNHYTIAEAYVNKSVKPFVIMDGMTPVGFLALQYDKKREDYWVMRLLIDNAYQGKGYGRAAINMGIQWMREHNVPWVRISFVPKNTVAERLYSSIGFKPTGEMDDDEIVCKIDL